MNLDDLKKAYSKYLDVLQLWCNLKFPCNANESYGALRGHVLRYAHYKEREGAVDSAIITINKKRFLLEKEIKVNADDYLFFGTEE